MSITDVNTYLNLVGSTPSYHIRSILPSITTVAGLSYSSWLAAGALPGLIPSTSTTGTDRGVQGALGRWMGNTLWNSTASIYLASSHANSGQAVTLMLCDRLVHMAGLNGTGTIQNIYLPMTSASAMTRYTGSCSGTMAAIEIYTAIGATQTTVSGSYINQNGSTSSFQSTQIGGANFDKASRFIILPLQDGDTGVQNVLSICQAASTATAGSYGITIFRPLGMYYIPNINFQSFLLDALFSNACQLVQAQNNACLFWVIVESATGAGIAQELKFITA